MTENRDLQSRLVVGQERDGRRESDEDAVRELVALCLKPGVSIARTAMEHSIIPNQLRRWISRYQQQQILSSAHDPGSASATTAFVPVVSAPPSSSTPPSPELSLALALHVRLPNDVEFDVGGANVQEIATIIQMLGRLACAGSTKV